MLLLPLLLATTALAASTKTQKNAKRDIIYSGASVNGQTFDYVISGGGLAGMVLAGRLSEDANRRILVIEAGYDEESRSTVTGSSLFLQPPSLLIIGIPYRSKPVSARIQHLARLAIQDDTATIRQQRYHDDPRRSNARRFDGNQWSSVHQASYVPARRHARSWKRWGQLGLDAGVYEEGRGIQCTDEWTGAGGDYL